MNNKSIDNRIIGDDGEFLQPDTSADLNSYTEFVASHIYRDPFWFRARNHVRENGCAYLFFAPYVLFGLLIVASIVVSSISGIGGFGEIVLVSIVELLVIGLLFR
ncbi:MAG: hypothetical protein R3E39_09240 [Anaerolineae bacterium]